MTAMPNAEEPLPASEQPEVPILHRRFPTAPIVTQAGSRASIADARSARGCSPVS
jgi:hypothetical protein